MDLRPEKQQESWHRRRGGWRRRRPFFSIMPHADWVHAPTEEATGVTTPSVQTGSPAANSDREIPGNDNEAMAQAASPASPQEPGTLRDHLPPSGTRPSSAYGGGDGRRGLLWARLGIGLIQSMALALLFVAHDRGVWPANEPVVSNALLLAGLMAPLVLLEGLGEVETVLLLLWSGTLGFIIATLGLWQQWRGGQTLLPAATIAVFVLIAHITVRAALREGRRLASYGTWVEIAWTVIARLLVWAAITAVVAVLVASGNGALDSLMQRAGITFPHSAILLSIALLGLGSALGFAVAAAGGGEQARSFLITCGTMALPVLIIAAAGLLGLGLFGMELPHGIFIVMAAALVICVHAFDQEILSRRLHRLVWAASGLTILGSTVAAGLDLQAGVAAHGWTDMRIYAAVATGVLAPYGLVYLVEAFSAPREASATRLVDRASPALALLVALVCLVLSTPLLDPLLLAVKSQTVRLQDGKDPAKFDFAWLRERGGRFGQQALTSYEHRASIQMTPAPGPAPQAPHPIAPAVVASGTNITWHSEGVLPASLFTQNWSGADVAPCLTKAAAACDAWFVDLDGDGEPELLLAYGDESHMRATVLKQSHGRWTAAASLESPPCRGLLPLMRSRGLLLANPVPHWRDVLVAGMRLTPKAAAPVTLPCPRS